MNGDGALFAFVGSYGSDEHPGGVFSIAVSDDGRTFDKIQHTPLPEQAGFIAYRPRTSTLYVVDERKTDGRGPVSAPAAVHSFLVSPAGRISALNVQRALGAFPTYLRIDDARNQLHCVSHGSFDHIERVVHDPSTGWRTEYSFDDSTVVTYALEFDGRVGHVADVVVMAGHGPDPNTSPQAGGHGQASAHAHCAVIDPSGRYLLVADKATDDIHVFAAGDNLRRVSVYSSPPQTGPRHLVFSADGTRVYATLEFSSELTSFDFDEGRLTLLSSVSTITGRSSRVNEPADVQIHPSGRTIYVNNRGEDTVAWFGIDDSGALERRGSAPLAPSVHPGLAARSLAIAESGRFLLVADRPASVLRSFGIADDGSLEQIAEHSVPDPAAVILVRLPPERAD